MSAVASGPVLSQIHPGDQGDILEIVLNRPHVHNAVDGETADRLLSLWRRFRDDDRLLVAILRGAGETSFCAGADLAALGTLSNLVDDPDARDSDGQSTLGTGPMGGTRLVQVKPIITVSQGFTYAGGLELFCHGHLRIAETNAMFSVACRRWGVPLVDGGTVYLPRLIGLGHALPLIITGIRINAEQAQRMGLVWEIVETGQGTARALEVAQQICRQPRDAMLADLASAIRGLHLPWEQALELEARNLIPVATSESMRLGVEAFLSGRRFWFK